MAIRKRVQEEAIVLTPEEFVHHFEWYVDGVEWTAKAEEGVIQTIKWEHGYDDYDDVDVRIEPPTPVEVMIEQHIKCLEITVSELVIRHAASINEVTGPEMWAVIAELNSLEDGFHGPEDLEWMIKLFQVDEELSTIKEKYGAMIERRIQEHLERFAR